MEEVPQNTCINKKRYTTCHNKSLQIHVPMLSMAVEQIYQVGKRLILWLC